MTNTGAEIRSPITWEIIPYRVLSYVNYNSIVKTFQHNDKIEDIIKSMQKSLFEWNKLLKISGGALSLLKCKVSVLSWKSNY